MRRRCPEARLARRTARLGGGEQVLAHTLLARDPPEDELRAQREAAVHVDERSLRVRERERGHADIEDRHHRG
ncbi:MAG: hypothetical protein R3F49_11295 [Planctomycetota bacterium]